MKALAGAVIILAGALLFAAGTLAQAMIESANRLGAPGVFAMFAGVVVGLIGFVVLLIGLRPYPEQAH